MRQPAGVVRGVEDEIDWREFNERGGPAMYCPTDWNFSADGEPLNAELRHAIQGATHQLRQDQREVFLLKDFADLTYEQIAEITGHSLPAIKHRLHQAKFLAVSEANGIELRNCPAYIREWVARKRAQTNAAWSDQGRGPTEDIEDV